MEQAERRDPKDWSRVMRQFFRMLSDGVEDFDGFFTRGSNVATG